jgi:hypothetical protein
MDPSSPVTHSLQHETGSSGRRFKSKLAAFLLAASGIGSAGTFSACVQNSQSSDGGVATVDMAQADDLAAPADLAPSRTELNNVDVTIIYPLPPAADINLLVWGNTLSNTHGRLVPLSAFSQIKMPLDPRPLSHTSTTGTTAWNELRLVAMRLDPCFGSRGEVPDAQCKNQVRLVFQGIHAVGAQSAADDGAIHVLYELPRDELLTLTREIVSLSDREGGYTPGPLGVHPILKRQGVWGSFGQGLKVLIRRYVGEDRAVRVTFFARTDSLQSGWHLGGFDRQGSTFVRLQIPTTLTSEQELFGGFPTAGDLAGSTPTPTTSADDIRPLLSSSVARLADSTTLKAAFGAALRIENPTKHTPDTIDCLGCHVAMATRTLGETQFGLSSIGHPDRFTSSRDLSFTPPEEPSLENLHASSYLGTELGLNQRTVNETAAVATALSELLRQ